jgi:hypothetical protein
VPSNTRSQHRISSQRGPRSQSALRHSAGLALFESSRKGGSVSSSSTNQHVGMSFMEARPVMQKGALTRSTLCWMVLSGWPSLLMLSCQRTDDAPPAQAGYAQPTPAPVQQAPGYGDGTTQQVAPMVATAPVTPTAAPSATLSQPGPLALPCQGDGQCLTHHCNIAAGKCAWPCQTDDDCMPGNRCVAPACLPKLQKVLRLHDDRCPI